jgi:hypothetical protein
MTVGGITVGAVGSSGRRFGRLEGISLAFALAWGTALVIAALLVPVYQSLSVSGSQAVIDGSATLVAVNGWGVLLAAGAPLAAAVVTGWALWRRTGRPGAGVLAWTVTGLLVCFNFLAVLSIGVFVIPATLALVIACANHRFAAGT